MSLLPVILTYRGSPQKRWHKKAHVLYEWKSENWFLMGPPRMVETLERSSKVTNAYGSLMRNGGLQRAVKGFLTVVEVFTIIFHNFYFCCLNEGLSLCSGKSWIARQHLVWDIQAMVHAAQQSTGWDALGKWSEVKVVQSCLTFCDSMDSSMEFSRPEYWSG